MSNMKHHIRWTGWVTGETGRIATYAPKGFEGIVCQCELCGNGINAGQYVKADGKVVPVCGACVETHDRDPEGAG